MRVIALKGQLLASVFSTAVAISARILRACGEMDSSGILVTWRTKTPPSMARGGVIDWRCGYGVLRGFRGVAWNWPAAMAPTC